MAQIEPVRREINFEAAIREHYDRLTKVEKKAVDYIITNESDIVWYSITDLAEKIGTSEATLIRTCKKLGFSGFQDFKINIALAKIHSLSKIENEITEVSKDDDVKTLVDKVRHMHVVAINEVFSNINYSDIEAIAKQLLRAKYINLLACGGTKAIAVDLNHKFLRMGLPSAVLTDQREQKMKAALAKPGDVFWGFNFSGLGTNIYDALMLARENGATIISLTNNKNSVIAKISDFKLFGVTNWLSQFTGTTDRLTQLAIIDALFLYIINLGGTKIDAALKKTQHIVTSDHKNRG